MLFGTDNKIVFYNNAMGAVALRDKDHTPEEIISSALFCIKFNLT